MKAATFHSTTSIDVTDELEDRIFMRRGVDLSARKVKPGLFDMIAETLLKREKTTLPTPHPRTSRHDADVSAVGVVRGENALRPPCSFPPPSMETCSISENASPPCFMLHL